MRESISIREPTTNIESRPIQARYPAKVTMPKSSDPWSIVVIVLTAALFILALFVTGLTKDLLVECGVLLVSIKLILMAKKTAEIEENLERRLDRIEKLLSESRVEKSS
jgi:uncharacterized membrane protein YbhN (UPF0104 family)